MAKRMKVTSNCGDEHDDNPGAPTDHAAKLPTEMLFRIFGQLDLSTRGRVAQVCNRWRNTVYIKSLWRHDETKFKNCYFHPVYHTLVPSLVQRGIARVNINFLHLNCERTVLLTKELFRDLANVRSLHLDKHQIIFQDHPLTDILQDIPPITNLRIDNCWYTQKLWEKLGGCPNLVSLDMATRCRSQCLPPLIIREGFVGFQNLQSLTMSDGPLTDDWMKSLAKNLLQLKSLTLISCLKITDAGIAYLSGFQPGTDPNTAVLPKLDALNLSGCYKLTDAALYYLSKGQRYLKTLKVDHEITAEGLMHLTVMRLLENLSLYFHQPVGEGLHELSTIKSLRRLWVSGWFDDTELALFSEWNSISINITIRSHISDQGLQYLARMTHLSELKLVFSFHETMSDLVRAIDGAPNITALKITNLSAIKSGCIEHICRLAGLRRLALDKEQMDDEGLDLIARTLHKLDMFVVGKADKMGELAMRQHAFVSSQAT